MVNRVSVHRLPRRGLENPIAAPIFELGPGDLPGGAGGYAFGQAELARLVLSEAIRRRADVVRAGDYVVTVVWDDHSHSVHAFRVAVGEPVIADEF